MSTLLQKFSHALVCLQSNYWDFEQDIIIEQISEYAYLRATADLYTEQKKKLIRIRNCDEMLRKYFKFNIIKAIWKAAKIILVQKID